MTPLYKVLTFALILPLAACGESATRFLIEAPPAAAPVRLRIASIELREVVLPAYGEDSQILMAGPDGGLRPLKGAEWADGTGRGVTAELARSLDLRGTAAVAAEPWPLSDPADVRLEVRIDQVVAGADGQFRLTGQFAVASPERRVRDRLQRFQIAVPLAGDGAAAVAAAYSAALGELSNRILQNLAGR